MIFNWSQGKLKIRGASTICGAKPALERSEGTIQDYDPEASPEPSTKDA
ncbi:hypothetical protein IH992_12265 [Candidatus Poribacteria bacterium]|nr:hypothetical protein [Candidatus Poribacteria bacterium]